MATCEYHPRTASVMACRACGGAFCENCLVYSYGPAKPPYCLRCALVAAGAEPTARFTSRVEATR